MYTTVPKLARLVGISENSSREEIEEGLLPAYQNRAKLQANKRAVYQIPLEALAGWVEGLPHLSDGQKREVLQQLSANFKQLNLFQAA
jgi:hypothetical protein